MDNESKNAEKLLKISKAITTTLIKHRDEAWAKEAIVEILVNRDQTIKLSVVLNEQKYVFNSYEDIAEINHVMGIMAEDFKEAFV